MMSSSSDSENNIPVFSKWSHWYWLLVIFLLVQIGVYTFLSNLF